MYNHTVTTRSFDPQNPADMREARRIAKRGKYQQREHKERKQRSYPQECDLIYSSKENNHDCSANY